MKTYTASHFVCDRVLCYTAKDRIVSWCDWGQQSVCFILWEDKSNSFSGWKIPNWGWRTCSVKQLLLWYVQAPGLNHRNTTHTPIPTPTHTHTHDSQSDLPYLTVDWQGLDAYSGSINTKSLLPIDLSWRCGRRVKGLCLLWGFHTITLSFGVWIYPLQYLRHAHISQCILC